MRACYFKRFLSLPPSLSLSPSRFLLLPRSFLATVYVWTGDIFSKKVRWSVPTLKNKKTTKSGGGGGGGDGGNFLSFDPQQPRLNRSMLQFPTPRGTRLTHRTIRVGFSLPLLTDIPSTLPSLSGFAFARVRCDHRNVLPPFHPLPPPPPFFFVVVNN